MPQHGDRNTLVPGNTAENALVIAALTVAPLFKEIRKQFTDVFIHTGTALVTCQKNPVRRCQIPALFQQRSPPCFQFFQRFGIFPNRRFLAQQLLFRIVFRCGIPQRVDALVQRFDLFENIFDHAPRFLPCVCSLRSCVRVCFISPRGTT